ncbi:MAG: CBS domain-containing protein [Nitrososphaera sp.]|uniref:CBS domain-containing protein n=1 Tax=Nitrososphaera sp. TaxID=1971748 RepID=UPI001826A968|nr:CBS domain-containing protein [Nitrososphaera sp.]NWG36821.1 CBS domain-containing protein [Nitrososphaera sp.]
MSVVSEIMTRGAVTVRQESKPTALDVAQVMAKSRTGSVIITAEGKPAGIITERDLLKKVSAKDRKPGEIPASQIMSSPVIAVKAYDSVDTAASVMAKNRIKRLAVIEDDGSLAGVISATDIAKKLARILADDYNRYGSLKAVLDL